MKANEATSVRARMRTHDVEDQTQRIRDQRGYRFEALDIVLEADRCATFVEQAILHPPVPPEGLDEQGRLAFTLQTIARHLREGRHRG
jgi:hypothetical protein